jgi:predicted PurR-regulated permease PerM
MADGGRGWRSAWQEEVAFLRRVLIVGAVIALALLFWTVRDALLLTFAAVVVAVLIRSVAGLAQRHLRVPEGWSVAVACLVIGLPLVGVFWLVGNEMVAQVRALADRLPDAIAAFESRFGVRVPVFGSAAGAEAGAPADSAMGSVAQNAASTALVVADILSALLLAIVGGVFIAADPRAYRRGVARLLPRSQNERVEEALDASGKALGLWVQAQLVAMAVVGLLTGLGAWAIGLPAPLALGLFAAIADFVPLIGPFVGAVPGVLLAISMGWETTLWTLALYLVVQQVEGNLLMPILGERMVSIPPALLLFSVVASGAVLGLGGVLLAAPLTVVAVVLVGKLYVRETLGRNVSLPGEEEEGG